MSQCALVFSLGCVWIAGHILVETSWPSVGVSSATQSRNMTHEAATAFFETDITSREREPHQLWYCAEGTEQNRRRVINQLATLPHVCVPSRVAKRNVVVVFIWRRALVCQPSVAAHMRLARAKQHYVYQQPNGV